MKKFKFAAPCLFGVEGIAAGEFERMGAENVKAENGRVIFEGDSNILARANICSRFSERIMIVVGEFEAHSFEDLSRTLKSFLGKIILERTMLFLLTATALIQIFSVCRTVSLLLKKL